MSILAIASPLLALLGLCLVVVAILGANVGLIPPLVAFLLAVPIGALLCGLLATVTGAVGLFRTRPQSHRTGAPQAWAGLLLGVLLMIGLLLAAPRGGALPIHDVTTDPADPPTFVAAAALPENAGRDLTYPHGDPETPTIQAEHYPDLGPVYLDVSPQEAMARVSSAIDQLGWSVTEIDREALRIEATDTSVLFRFVDDVVVRIRDEGARVRVDARSTSRVGQSDLGANAARLRALKALLKDEPEDD